MVFGSQLRRCWLRYHPSRRPRSWIAIAFVVLFTLFYFSYEKDPDPIPVRSIVIVGRDDMNGIQRNKRIFSDSMGCNIPKLETFGAELAHLIRKSEPLNCVQRADSYNWVYVDENGKLVKRRERKDAECQIEYFQRETDEMNKIIKKESVIEQTMSSDFGIVKCIQDGEVWESPVMAVIRNETLVQQAKKRKTYGEDQPLDIVMFGFDSMSQQHFRRKMPKTVAQLENMGSVIFNGYNIVGDGTPQAFIPILTGKTELELPNTRKRYNDANYVNVYPFVWNNFSEKGYVTLFGEDAFKIGMFTYRLKGFNEQPTDHYTRNFYKEVESLKINRGQIGKCIGSEPAFQSWFQYSRHFLKQYKDMPKFLVMHQDSLSHDDINLIDVEDEYFSNHLAGLKRDGLLDNALLIVMADHGHRFTKIRDTQQGQLEERLPMFSITLPKKFKESERGKKIQENVLTNKDVLTSPFDVYETFLDILDPPDDVSKEQDTKKRGMSMFRPIPKKRTCEEADIEAHWCTCLNWQNATLTKLDRQQTEYLAEGLAKAIDNQLIEVKDLCANVTLKKVISATKLTPNDGLLRYKSAKDMDGINPIFKNKAIAVFAHYRLKIMTSPNDAIYERTVYFDGRFGKLEVDLQSLSHVNAYGDDPYCVVQKHNTLALYCVCHDRVKNI